MDFKCSKVYIFLFISFLFLISVGACKQIDKHNQINKETFNKIHLVNDQILIDSIVLFYDVAVHTEDKPTYKDRCCDFIVNIEENYFSARGTENEFLKGLDTLLVRSKNNEFEAIKRYLIGLGRIDGLSVVGISSDNRLLFIQNSTWGTGIVSTDFIESISASEIVRAIQIDLEKPDAPSLPLD